MKKYTLAEAKKLLTEKGPAKKRKIVKRTKEKMHIGGHTVKRVEYLTANPAKRELHPIKWVVEIKKYMQSPWEHLYLTSDNRITHDVFDARKFSTESAAMKRATELKNSNRISKSVYALNVTEMRQ